MENMISNNLTNKHKLILLLIDRVKSASTIYNIDQTSNLLGVYIENSYSILKDLVQLDFIISSNKLESLSKYSITPTGRNYLNVDKDLKKEMESIVMNKDLLTKLCFSKKEIIDCNNTEEE